MAAHFHPASQMKGVGMITSANDPSSHVLPNDANYNILELKGGYNTMAAATQTFSGNMKVSYFGGGGQTDTGDFWRVEIEGSGKTWKQDQRIRLKHVDTSGYLHSHDKKYTRIAEGSERCAAFEIRNPTTSGWRRRASTFRFPRVHNCW